MFKKKNPHGHKGQVSLSRSHSLLMVKTKPSEFCYE